MPEYYLESGNSRSETFLGSTPNTDGDFPLESPNRNRGNINQQFSVNDQNELVLKISAPLVSGRPLELYVTSGTGRTRIDPHDSLVAYLREDAISIRQRVIHQ